MRKALVVGIDDYYNCPLKGCCKDAEAVANILKTNGDNSPNFDVRLEKNVQTKSTLKSYIKECFSGYSDVALFYYSGHGAIDDLGGYIVTPDYQKEDLGVSLEDVLKIVNESRCKERIVIIDSCHSGALGNIGAHGQNTAHIKNGVTLLTACMQEETAVESNGHGIFTSLLLEALSGEASDLTGCITTSGIYTYMDKALGAWNQRPVYKTNVSHFTPIRKVSPPIDAAILRRLNTYFSNENAIIKLNPSFEFTNSPNYKIKLQKPYADEENVQILKDLQKLESVGLVKPIGTEHMYFAAMESKSCGLTLAGMQYWRLANNSKI